MGNSYTYGCQLGDKYITSPISSNCFSTTGYLDSLSAWNPRYRRTLEHRNSRDYRRTYSFYFYITIWQQQ